MADTVTTQTVFAGKEYAEYRFTNVSDGTGETSVHKIVRSTLTNSMGVVPATIMICEFQWSIQGFSSVTLAWDHTSPNTIEVLSAGNGFRLYMPEMPPINDPGGAGGTGDVILSTAGAVAGATYDIAVKIKLSE